jgi:hypothetical protein
VTLTDHSVAFSGLATINYTGASKGSDGVVRGVDWLTVRDGRKLNTVQVKSKPALTTVTLDLCDQSGQGYPELMDTVIYSDPSLWNQIDLMYHL